MDPFDPERVLALGGAAVMEEEAVLDEELPAKVVTDKDLDRWLKASQHYYPHILTKIRDGFRKSYNGVDYVLNEESWYVLPNQIIGEGTFVGCGSLPGGTKILISEGNTLKNGAFEGSNVHAVTFHPAITTIPERTFCDCLNLRLVKGIGIKSIQRSAFVRSSVIDVIFPFVTSIDISCFDSCQHLRSVTFPLLNQVPLACFKNCSNLEVATLPMATIFNNEAFELCEKLRSVHIPKAKSIRNNVFYRCDALKNVPELSNLEYVGIRAFGLTGLMSFKEPNMSTVFEKAFFCCMNLTHVDLPEAVRLEDECFLDCYALQVIHAPRVRHIKARAFQNCRKLKKAYFPNAKTVGTESFKECVNLEDLNLSSVDTFTDDILLACYSLQHITIKFAQSNIHMIKELFRDCRDLKGNNTILVLGEKLISFEDVVNYSGEK